MKCNKPQRPRETSKFMLTSDLVQNNIIDITVTYDGTWHKGGHTSLYRISIVIDVLTNIVVDFEAKTHQHLNEKVYGDDVAIEKEECIDHVAKCLGTALWNKVKEWQISVERYTAACRSLIGCRYDVDAPSFSSCRAQSLYRYAFKLSSIRTRDVRVVYPTAVQAIKLGVRSLYRYPTQAGEAWSPQSLTYKAIRILYVEQGVV
ncbi:uncharacterized protein TNCV_4517921 [Trichonephila clavipes]|nr:uncharacterized protein TNCV_4517921 [Trichonephila clavipes]